MIAGRVAKALVAIVMVCPSHSLLSAQVPTDPKDPAVIAQSQERQPISVVATWLGSGDARTRAWGAYQALRDQRQELLPQLIALAEANVIKDGSRSPSDPDHDAMVGVLDAIIQLNGRVPEAAAARLYPEFPAQSMILLARAGSQDSAHYLLNIFQQGGPRTGEWLAAGNFLTNAKLPGFAAAVLQAWAVQASIRVIDRGSGPGTGHGSVGDCGPGLASLATGWPAVGNYNAAASRVSSSYYGAGSTIVFGGTDPMMYVRKVGRADTSLNAWECGNANRDVYREHFLAGLASESSANPTVRSSVSATILWESSDQYLKDLRSFIDREQTLFDTLARKLIAAGLLSTMEWESSRPSLKVRIADDRSVRQSELSVLQNVEGNVSITK